LVSLQTLTLRILRSVGGGHRAATTEAPAEAEWRWRAEEQLRQNGLGFAEPLGHACSVKKSVQLVNDWFEAKGDFHAFSGSPGTRAGLGRLRDPKPLLKLGPHIGKKSLNCRIKGNRIHGWAPFGATHACCAGEVERNASNLMAHLADAGSHSELLAGRCLACDPQLQKLRAQPVRIAIL